MTEFASDGCELVDISEMNLRSGSCVVPCSWTRIKDPASFRQSQCDAPALIQAALDVLSRAGDDASCSGLAAITVCRDVEACPQTAGVVLVKAQLCLTGKLARKG
jgi:hypothetical protein